MPMDIKAIKDLMKVDSCRYTSDALLQKQSEESTSK
jgi:hypothetical protein